MYKDFDGKYSHMTHIGTNELCHKAQKLTCVHCNLEGES